MEGSDGDCGSCCLFARSGETGKSGVPGEAGNLKTGSIRFVLASSESDVFETGTEMQAAGMDYGDVKRVRREKQNKTGGCANCVAGQRPTSR